MSWVDDECFYELPENLNETVTWKHMSVEHREMICVMNLII